MKTKQLFYASALVLTATFIGCKKDDPEPTPDSVTPVTYEDGVFITNEGPFGSGTGTISFYNRTTKKVANDIFQTKNSYPLGNIVQSMAIHNGKGYVVVNNAAKIEIVDATSFASVGAISGLTSPRNFLGIDATKAYVSEWGVGGSVGAIKVVNLTTKAVTSTISTGKGAEEMVKVGNKVYVTCSGGFSDDSVVTVIDATTNTVIKNITVGANPKGIKVDANGDVWVLCSGDWNSSYTALEKTGRIVHIDSEADSVLTFFNCASTTSQPSNLVINKEKTKLYYSYSGAVYEMSLTLSATPVINRSFYALAIDPVNNDFYGSDAGNFSSNGKVIRYNSSAVAIDSFTVGVIPGNFCFK